MTGFSPADALRLSFVDDAGFLGDGRHGYYSVTAVDGDRDTTGLWLFDRTDGTSREVTGSFRDPRWPRPAPDGERLAFVADVDGTPQVLIASAGGAGVLTALAHGVSGAPSWSPKGEAVAFVAGSDERRDPSRPYRASRPTWRYEGVGVIEDALRDVYVADTDSGQVRRLTTTQSVCDDPRWSPDGQRIVFRVSFPPDGRPWAAKPSAHVVDVRTGEHTVTVGDWGGVLEADWCPDGERIVFRGAPAVPGTADIHDAKHDLWTVDARGGTPECRTAGLLGGVGVWLEFDHPTHGGATRANLRVDAAADAVYARAQRGGDVVVCRAGLSGDENLELMLAVEGRSCFLADADPAGDNLLYVASTLVEPPELYLRDGDGERRITHLNDEVLGEQPQTQSFTVEVPDGPRIDAWAVTPPGDGPFPVVLAIHGGPWDAYGTVFMADHHLLAGVGIAVVFANFRSSGGYGTQFMQSLHGRWGPLGEHDHHAVLDRAIELGIADPDRLGVYGLSHGGFATCWLAGRSNRFRPGVAENPVVNFTTEYALMDSPWWVAPTLGALPDEDPGLYAELSPITYAKDCTTPLLFVVGEADLRCPPAESEQYYRVLQSNGVEAQLQRLPGANHLGSWTGPVPARAAQNDALVEWFSHHLLDGGDAS
jgi:dipeptidyl aminopeptidase/acylaminoacyl peptidase